ncbi:MAG: stage V sporulation protein E [Parcubacteria group bacterium]|nr:MAG: stage V sporulation protein E [Parcubacteria group bacterium]
MVRKRRSEIISWFLEPFIPRRGQGHQPDFVLLVILGVLLFMGLLFLSSASSTMAFYKFGDTYFYVKQQLVHGLLIGAILFYICIRINFDWYRRMAPLFLLGSLALLGLVFISNFVNHYGTARSWIVLGNFSFQPSELVKLFYILFLAGWCDRLGRKVGDWSTGFLPFIFLLATICLLIILQPDIGTLSIIVLVSLAMYFAAGAKWKHLGIIVVAGSIFLVTMIKFAAYRMSRILVWLHPDLDPQGAGWQIKQSLIAIGSGGWFGVGLGSSRQKSYLPQPANDSIFPIISEEIGFVFTAIFLLLFVILIFRGFKIARHSEDNFAKLTAIGITVWLAVQIFINIAGMTNLLPMTGVPLTFISLGGSNLAVSLAAMGILANISKYTGYARI